jgi:hypothetical protein
MEQNKRRHGALAGVAVALVVLLAGCGAQTRTGATPADLVTTAAEVQLVSVAGFAVEQAAPIAASPAVELDQLRAADQADERRLAQITALRQQAAAAPSQALAQATRRHHCINS